MFMVQGLTIEINCLVLSREYGNVVYRDYCMFPSSPVRTSRKDGAGCSSSHRS